MFQKIHFTPSLFLGFLILGLGISPLLGSNTQEKQTVTANRYLSYLNSAGSNDNNHLYELKMGEGENQILRLGTPGNYYYLAPIEQEEKSLLFLPLVPAQFYCDWEKSDASAFLDDDNIINQNPQSEDPKAVLPYLRFAHYDPLLASNIIIHITSLFQEDLTTPHDDKTSLRSWKIGGAILAVIITIGGATYSCSYPMRSGDRLYANDYDDSIPTSKTKNKIPSDSLELPQIFHTYDDEEATNANEAESVLKSHDHGSYIENDPLSNMIFTRHTNIEGTHIISFKDHDSHGLAVYAGEKDQIKLRQLFLDMSS